MQLANLGSADMESLIQGANIQELALGNQLLMPGGMDAAGMGGGQPAQIFRLLDASQLAADAVQAADGQQDEPQGEQQHDQHAA